MARIARVVPPGMPHHITQRGNRRQQTFFSDADYAAYIDLMAQWCGKYAVDIWAYCLMPNHLHVMVRVKNESEILEFLRVKKSNPNLQGFQNLGGLEENVDKLKTLQGF